MRQRRVARLASGELVAGGAQRQFVADGAETDDEPDRDVGEVGVVPELFPGMHVAQVHLDERNLHASNASRSATLVWVKPPGLKTMKATRLAGAWWMRSISSASALLWKAVN